MNLITAHTLLVRDRLDRRKPRLSWLPVQFGRSVDFRRRQKSST